MLRISPQRSRAHYNRLQYRRMYRYGLSLLLVGALCNWIGFAQHYFAPVRYLVRPLLWHHHYYYCISIDLCSDKSDKRSQWHTYWSEKVMYCIVSIAKMLFLSLSSSSSSFQQGVGCVIAGALCICIALCRWLTIRGNDESTSATQVREIYTTISYCSL